MRGEIESTLRSGLNIGNLENVEKLEILVLEVGTFCDELRSAIVLSVILDVSCNQTSQMLESW